MCWADLSAVAADVVPVPETRAQRWRRALWRRRAPVAAVLVVALLGAWYLQARGGPSPMPAPASTLSMPAAGAAWPSEHGSAGGVRLSSARPELGGAVEWRAALRGQPSAAPVTDGETLFVALSSGELLALDTSDGSERWRTEVPGALDASPALAGDLLIVARRDRVVTALERESGRERWTARPTLTSIHEAPVVDAGMVYIASLQELAVLDAETGKRLWHREFDNYVTSNIALSSRRIALATGQEVRLFDRATGEETYVYRLVNGTQLALVDGLLLGVGERRLLAIDETSSRPWWEPFRAAWVQFAVWKIAPDVPPAPLEWAASTPAPALGAAVVDGLAVVAWPSGLVRAYEVMSGEVRWEQRVEAVTAPPTALGDRVLLVAGGDLVALSVQDGTEVARTGVGGARSAVAAGGAVYVLTDGAEVLALR